MTRDKNIAALNPIEKMLAVTIIEIVLFARAPAAEVIRVLRAIADDAEALNEELKSATVKFISPGSAKVN